MSDSETPSPPSRRWRFTATPHVVVLVVVVAGVLAGAVLVGDLGRASCEEVLNSKASIMMRLYDPSTDQMEAIGQLAQTADRHPRCFTDDHRRGLRDLSEHGPPELSVLHRPRTERDDAHGLQAPTEMVLSEARFARSTQHGSFYVIPKNPAGGPRQVCLYFDRTDGGSSLSCEPLVVASATGNHPYPIVATVTVGYGGVAGIVGDGPRQVLVDGKPVPVHDNVFVAEFAPPDADVQVPS